MTSPRISVVMPCFNAARHLRATLESLAAQTLADWELIAVDDGSTDATWAILAEAEARDPRIRAVRTPNGGPSRARNLGAIGLARADLLAFLDADDLCVPERLARLVETFDARPGTAGLYGRVGFFRTDPARPDAISAIRRTPLSASVLLGENPVCTTSNLALRLDAFRDVAGFDERLVHHEDVDLLLRLVAAGARIEGIDALQVRYRTSEAGLSADLDAMRRGWRETLERADSRAPLDRATRRRAEAIHLRYLARRALRTGHPAREARRLAVAGFGRSPVAFFDIPRRGALTLAGALAAPFLPRALRRRLFA